MGKDKKKKVDPKNIPVEKLFKKNVEG